MCSVPVLCFIAGESSKVKDTDIITVMWLKRNGMEMIHICEVLQRGDPAQLTSNPVKSTKLRISRINILSFFHKSKTHPCNLKI